MQVSQSLERNIDVFALQGAHLTELKSDLVGKSLSISASDCLTGLKVDLVSDHDA